MISLITDISNNPRYLLLTSSFVGVSKAILEAAGQAVEDECQKLGKMNYFMAPFNHLLYLKTTYELKYCIWNLLLQLKLPRVEVMMREYLIFFSFSHNFDTLQLHYK